MAPPLCMTQQYCPASMAAQIFSKGIPCCNLLSHVPSSHLLQSTAVFSWNSSPTAMLQLPPTVLTWGPISLSRVHRATVQIVCVVLSPLSPSEISCFKCLTYVPNYVSHVGLSPPPVLYQVQFQPQSLFLFFPSLPSIVLQSCVEIPSSGLGLLPPLSWCSVRYSVSEDVFLMYPWREKYSMSTYSSAILS